MVYPFCHNATVCLLGSDKQTCLQVCHGRAYTHEQQMELIQSVAAMMAEEPFKLLIVDSITANLRVDFTGRGELAERQQRLGQMMSRLRKVSCRSRQQSAA